MVIERADVGTFCYTECRANIIARLSSEYKLQLTPALSASPSLSRKPSFNPWVYDYSFLKLFFTFVSLNFVPILCALHWSHNNSYAPLDQPSAPPTGSLYYPDWENEEQICVNDRVNPKYMKQIQRDNYLYYSNEECCEVSAMIPIDGIQIDVHYILDIVFFNI